MARRLGMVGVLMEDWDCASAGVGLGALARHCFYSSLLNAPFVLTLASFFFSFLFF